LVAGILANGGTPDEVMQAIPWRKNRLFEVFEGELDFEQVQEEIMKSDTGGRHPRIKRFFCNDGEIFHFDNQTYVLTNQWGKKALEATENLAEAFPKLNITLKACQ
jgi:hypothetical protein